ncbi:MAG: aspartate aminotransferase family protein [Nitrososphaerales archaeon]
MEKSLSECLNHAWIHNLKLSEHFNKAIIFTKGKGSRLWDIKGKEYLDATSAVFNVNIGYGDLRVIEAIKKQLEKLSFCSPYMSSDSTLEFLKELIKMAPNFKRVFLTSSGSDATETAIKMAKQYYYLKGKEKYRIIGRWISYHGDTLGALSASGIPNWRKPFESLLLNFPHIAPAYCYRCWFGKEPNNCALKCALDLEKWIRIEGEDSISAFIAEPIVAGAGGALTPPRDYFKIIREICDKYDILLVFDEVVTGFGRTGKTFAFEHFGVEPDLMVFGKGATSGYAPLGGVFVSKKVSEVFEEAELNFVNAFTYGHSPSASSAGLEVLRILREERLVERVDSMGKYLFNRLKELERYKMVGEIRGKGFFVGIELVEDKATRKIFPDDREVGKFIEKYALDKGILIFGRKGADAGLISDFLTFAPIFISTKEELDRIVDTIEEGIRLAEEKFL